MPVLLSTAYCPPVEYFVAIASEFDWRSGRPAEVTIEACEHYQKQSWRNRCRIYAGDGPLDLNFPIIHSPDPYITPVSEIKIDRSTDWLTRHKRAIVSAYMASPYFEYYSDEFFAVLDSRREGLLDYNTAILRFFLEKFHIDASVGFTSGYIKPVKPESVKPIVSADLASGMASVDVSHAAVSHSVSHVVSQALSHAASSAASDVDVVDLRYAIHPKRDNRIMESLGLNRPYYQVFADRYGFIPHLSAMDLLFNEGPDSLTFLISPDRI